MLARLFVSALALTQAVIALPLQKRDFGGEATHYTVGLGACGNYNNDGELVVAMNAAQYAGGAHCGQSVTISFGGKTATATVVDLCPGCAFGDLDMSPTLFTIFNPLGVGRFKMAWSFGGGGGGSPPPPETPPPPPPPKETPPPPPPPSPTPEWTPPPQENTPPPPPKTSEAPPPPPQTSEAVASLAPPSSEAAPSSSSSLSVMSSASPSSTLVPSSSIASTVSASLNSTSIASNTTVLPTTTASALNITHPTSSSSNVPVDVVVSNSVSDEEAGGNLASLNNLVATFGRLVVIAAQ